MTKTDSPATDAKTTVKPSVVRMKMFIMTGVFAAFTAVCSIISIPLPFTPVPLNLAMLAVFMSGAILGPKFGPLSQIVFLLMGAIGIPVFANFKAGVGVLIGPTGGYLAGYVAAALLIGWICSQYNGSAIKQTIVSGLAMLSGLLVCYILGVAWLMYLTKTPVITALLLYAAPFIPGDMIKLAAAVLLSGRLTPIMTRV